MELLSTALDPELVYAWETWLSEWSFYLFIGLFGLELLWLAVRKRLTWNVVGDGATNYLTLGFYLVITYGLIGGLYVSAFYWAQYLFAITSIPVTVGSVLLCLLACDFAYYWEHRFAHRVGLAWATHTVHHSSPYFNLSVANRFGPLDGLIPLPFHLPLVIVGFDPLVVFACEVVVQVYQTWLHTELVGKLPRPIEALFNTPSHHRVHHGANPQYLDKNYGGILIIWDRLFGSFAREQEPVRYGLTEPIESINPFVAFGHGLWRLGRRCYESRGFGERCYALVAPPEWQPTSVRASGSAQVLGAAESP